MHTTAQTKKRNQGRDAALGGNFKSKLHAGVAERGQPLIAENVQWNE